MKALRLILYFWLKHHVFGVGEGERVTTGCQIVRRLLLGRRGFMSLIQGGNSGTEAQAGTLRQQDG